MTVLRRLAVFAALGILAPVAPALAADMPEYIPEQPAPQFGGWYLRGDIGFSNQRVGSLYNILYETTEVTNIFKDFDAAPFGGVGIGYQFSNYFRIDITGEYRGKATFHGLDTYLFNDVELPGEDPDNFVPRIDDYNGSKSELTFLANAYIDLGNFQGIIPFVGVGVGASYNTISNFTDTDPTSGDFFGPAFATGATASTWDFAWAVYAGLGYQVNDKLTLEVAYRYISLGSAQSGDLVPYDGPGEIVNPMYFNDLTSHDFKIGFRYAIN